MQASPAGLTRRAALAAGAAAAAAATLPRVAGAAGVQPYKDIAKGFSLLRPSGWNEFDAAEGQYDVKWVDVIQPLEFVTVLTSPVAKGKTLESIGECLKVGETLASGRGGRLIAGSEVVTADEKGYLFEISKGGNVHQLTLLTIAKSKLYSINASCSEARWGRREKLLREVVASFKPKL
jgi:photosystem II oxygen-evolving enhancer protein 2